MVRKLFPVNVFSYEPFEGEMVLIARIEQFTNEYIHLPGKRRHARYSFSIDGQRIGCNIEIFDNGFSESTEGHVCIAYPIPKDLELCCIISVIDVFGNQRFPRSFIIKSMTEQEYETISYISRETLLSDPDELLPNDTLTLTIRMPFVSIYEAMLTERFLRCLDIDNTFHIDESFGRVKSFRLNLDSTLAMRLKEESKYFRGITSAQHKNGKSFDPRIEFRTSSIFNISSFFNLFQHIEKVFSNKKGILVFESVKEIFDLWFIAHKYDIPTVIESCRGFLKLCLFNHTIDDYYRLINECIDIKQRKLIKPEIDAVSLTDFDRETESNAKEIRLKEPIRGRQWVYEHSRQNLAIPILDNDFDKKRQRLYFHRFQVPPLYFKFLLKKANVGTVLKSIESYVNPTSYIS